MAVQSADEVAIMAAIAAEQTEPEIPHLRGRLAGYSSGPMQWESVKSMVPVVNPKPEASRDLIRRALRACYLFKDLDRSQIEETVDAMEENRIPAGTVVVRKGDDGDYFYVIESGTFEVDRTGENPIPRILNPGDSFGEIALLLNRKRTATAMTDAVLWRVDRFTFRRMLMQHAVAKSEKYADFLRTLPLFASLDQPTLMRTIDALQLETFAPGAAIVRQFEMGDKFYIVESGRCHVYIQQTPQSEPVYVREIAEGQYFGEKALIEKTPRTATVRAAADGGDVRCLVLDAETFERLVDRCDTILAKRMQIYV